MKIRRARPTDLPAILRWRRDAAAWLSTLGTDQWSDEHYTDLFDQRVTQSIAHGQTWIAEDHTSTPLGTIAIAIAIDEHPDPDLWTPDELHDAYVLHRMIVDRAATGRGIGATLLDHAEHLARQAGLTKLLLDAWTSNTRLHDYYLAHGFHHIRTVADHITPSAALFARPVRQASPSPTVNPRHRHTSLRTPPVPSAASPSS